MTTPVSRLTAALACAAILMTPGVPAEGEARLTNALSRLSMPEFGQKRSSAMRIFSSFVVRSCQPGQSIQNVGLLSNALSGHLWELITPRSCP
jgi:hypothetical protein